ncbi:MAG TPA: cytochrome C oxidase subunit IV family protein [Terracidiphilus sp.]|jgi:cytochrome c oxidase subunit 4|nr:cytochrome C oxidase subunit IV family protein [Terracidiphilus sp.]
MSEHNDPHHGTGHDHGPKEQDVHDSLNHIVPPRIYIMVGTALLILTGATAAVSYVDLGVFNAVAALFIACTKASIVVLFFMHVKYSSKLTKLTLFSGLFLFSVLIALTLSDYGTRAWGRW